MQCCLYYLLFALLVYGYYVFVAPFYGYYGFDWKPLASKFIESLFLLLVALLFTPSKFKRPSDILLNIQLIFPILGMLVLYGAADKPRQYIYMVIFLYVVMAIIASKIKVMSIRMMRLSLPSTEKILIGVAFLIILSIVLFGEGIY